MPWDKALPDGDVNIASGDDAIRANNDAIEGALGEEHEFSTGGTNTGRHIFVIDTTANIAAMSPSPPAAGGTIAIDTTPRGVGNGCITYYDGSSWQIADVGKTDLPRLDENTEFTAQQWATWEIAVPAANELDIDLTGSPCKYATLSSGALTTIQNPTGYVSGACAQVLLQVTMSGAGNSIAWDSDYLAAGGAEPAYDAAAGAVNLFYLTIMQQGSPQKVFVTSAAGIATF